jgi:hypothetical protein
MTRLPRVAEFKGDAAASPFLLAVMLLQYIRDQNVI